MTEISITLPNNDVLQFDLEEDYITREDDSTFTRKDAILDPRQAELLVAGWTGAKNERKHSELPKRRSIYSTLAPHNRDKIFVMSSYDKHNGLDHGAWQVLSTDDDGEYRLSQFPMAITWAMEPELDHEEEMQAYYYANMNTQLFNASIKVITADMKTTDCVTVETRIHNQVETHIAFLKEYESEIPDGYATWLYTELRRVATEAIQIEGSK